MGRGRSQKSIALVEAAYAILEDTHPASVRAVCYQCFIRGIIAGMDKGNTNRVGALLTRAREEGEIPWEWSRSPRKFSPPATMRVLSQHSPRAFLCGSS